MSYIYVLLLEGNKYYIGKTNSVSFRVNDHFTNGGSAWTTKYKPKSVVLIKQIISQYDEDNYVKRYMASYGIDNVRGGSYSQVELPEYILSYLEKEINSPKDKCFINGKYIYSNHYLASVDVNNNIREVAFNCYRCGRPGHSITNCYATCHSDGYILKNNR